MMMMMADQTVIGPAAPELELASVAGSLLCWWQNFTLALVIKVFVCGIG